MMRKLTLLIVFIIASLASLFAQSNIDVKYKEIKKLVVDGNIIINIYPSTEDGVSVKGAISTQANAELFMQERKKELQIKRKSVTTFKKGDLDTIVLNVYIKEPNDIEAKSRADIRFSEQFVMDQIRAEATGSATISLLASVRISYLKAGSSGKIVMIGASPEIEMKSNGGASINTIQTESEQIKATATTNGECYVKASGLLVLKATSYGNIFYKGEVEQVVKDISTFGHIESF